MVSLVSVTSSLNRNRRIGVMKKILVILVLGIGLAAGESVPRLKFPVNVDFTSSGVPEVESIADKFKKISGLERIFEKYELPYRKGNGGTLYGE